MIACIKRVLVTFLSWLFHLIFDFLFLDKSKLLIKTPKWIIILIKWILIILSLPFNIFWFGLSYLWDLVSKKKCYIKMINDDNNKWSWMLCWDHMNPLFYHAENFDTKYECIKNAKSSLNIRYTFNHKTDWKYDYYTIYIPNKEYKEFYKLSWWHFSINYSAKNWPIKNK